MLAARSTICPPTPGWCRSHPCAVIRCLSRSAQRRTAGSSTQGRHLSTAVRDVLEAQQRLLNAGFTYDEASTMLKALEQQHQVSAALCMDTPGLHSTAGTTSAAGAAAPMESDTRVVANPSPLTLQDSNQHLTDKISGLEQRLDSIQLDLTRALLQQPDMGLLVGHEAAEAQRRLSGGGLSPDAAYSMDTTSAGTTTSGSSSNSSVYGGTLPGRSRRSGILWRAKVAHPLAARSRRPERFLADDWAVSEEELEEGIVPYRGTAAASVAGWVLGGYLMVLLCIVMLAVDGHGV